MKAKFTAIFLTAALLCAGCGGAQEQSLQVLAEITAAEAVKSEVTETVEETQTETEETEPEETKSEETKPEETEPPEEYVIDYENLTPEDFIELDSGWFADSGFSYFTSINEISLYDILNFSVRKMSLPYVQLTYEQRVIALGERTALVAEGGEGIYPEEADKYIKEYINPDFSIDNYDYRNLEPREGLLEWTWSEELGMIVLYVEHAFGGGPVYESTILDSYESEGKYYYYTGGFGFDGYDWRPEYEDVEYVLKNAEKIKEGENEYFYLDVEYNLYVFEKGENGRYYLVSKTAQKQGK